MSLLQILLLVFLLIPLAEIYVLIKVGSIIGAVPTVALVVLTAVVGAALMRAQGFRTLARVQAALAAGEIPAVEMLEGAFILVAGALLLTPGFVTDIAGFVLLVRPVRLWIIRSLLAHRGQVTVRPHGRVIEGEVERDEDQPREG